MKTDWPSSVPVLTERGMCNAGASTSRRMNLDQWHVKVFGPFYRHGYDAVWYKLREAAGIAVGQSLIASVVRGELSHKEQARIWNKVMRAFGYTEITDGAWDE